MLDVSKGTIMSYEIKSNYDYTQHWSKRDKEEPRLAGKDHAESLKEFHHQFAQAWAKESYQHYNDPKKCEKIFDNILAREMYHMATENLYGFGKYVLNHTLWPIINDLYNSVLEEYEQEIVYWWLLSLQCSSCKFSNESEWADINAEYISNLKSFGIDVNYENLQLQERQRINLYNKEEDMWIKSSNGYRGD